MLWKANELCTSLSHSLTAVVLGGKDEAFVADIAKRADKVLVVEDDRLKEFNADLYKGILLNLIGSTSRSSHCCLTPHGGWTWHPHWP